MDISKLKENVVSTTVKYNGETIKIDLAPDVLTTDDGNLPVAEYVHKALKAWDITVSGEPLDITVDILRQTIPDGVLTLIFDKILELKQAAVGKLKIVK